jgi:type II secretory pathway pseudopilin PulG
MKTLIQKQSKGKDDGFTLLEVIIYTAIFVAIIGLVGSYFFWAMRTGGRVKAMNRNFDEMSRVMHFLEQEIKAASNVYKSTSSAAQLTLATSKYSDSNEDYVYADFYQCGTRLCYKIDDNSPIAVTSDQVNITALNFTPVATSSLPSVIVHLEMEYAPMAGRPGYEAFSSATTTISVRGYDE